MNGDISIFGVTYLIYMYIYIYIKYIRNLLCGRAVFRICMRIILYNYISSILQFCNILPHAEKGVGASKTKAKPLGLGPALHGDLGPAWLAVQRYSRSGRSTPDCDKIFSGCRHAADPLLVGSGCSDTELLRVSNLFPRHRTPKKNC